MRFTIGAGSVVVVSVLVAAGCSSDSTTFHGTDGGDASAAGGGPSTGGRTSTGGSTTMGDGSTSGAGTGGTASAGGASNAGGAAGSGGSGGAPACAPPADKTQTAICVTLAPERITPESDPALDQKGVFLLQVFDTPTPPDKNASAIALAERVAPANPGTAEVALDSLTSERIVGTFPSLAYVRAVFIDDKTRLGHGAPLGAGTWIGGIDLSAGLKDKTPLLPVTLKVGEGNALSLPLSALRKLTVKVHASAKPVGDGQGPLAALVVNAQDPSTKPPIFGAATSACANIATDVTLTGFVIGKGPYWVTGALNDIGLSGDFPPGTLAAIDIKGNKASIPQALAVPSSAYSISTSIDLTYAVPWPADAGPIPPNSCADLLRPDAGAPDSGVP